MKYIICFLLFVFCYACKSDVTPPPIKKQEKTKVTAPTRLDSLEKMAFVISKKDPIKAIPYFIEISNIYAKENNKPKQAIAHLNLSSIYDEYTKDTKQASHHGHMSLGLWELEKDTMQMANLFNYCGYLSAKEGNVAFGKLQLNKAEQLYIGLNNLQGKANTYLNIARVHLIEQDYKRTETFYKLAKKYWEENFNAGRLLGINEFGIEMYTAMNNKSEVQKIIKENEQLIKKVQ